MCFNLQCILVSVPSLSLSAGSGVSGEANGSGDQGCSKKRWAANSVTKNKRREIFTQMGGSWSPHHVDEIAYSFWSLGDNNLNLVLLKRNNNTPPPPDG